MAWAPAQKPGDTDPLISDAKHYLGRFSYGKGLGDTDEYTVEFGVALLQFQSNRKVEVDFGVKPGPRLTPNGVFDWATKKQMGLIPDPPSLPKKVIYTVAGHLGDMFTGPAYVCARWLEERGLVKVQPIGYNNVDIPFRNQTGIDGLFAAIHDPVIRPPGVDYAIAAHSQGAIVAAYVMETIVANRSDPAYAPFKGGLQFGNPRRPKGVVAPWVTDPPPAENSGLAHNCLTAAIPGVAEVSRRKDLYADKKLDSAGEYKTAVYRLVAEGTFIGGEDTLAEQMGELVMSGGLQLWDVFMAITGAIGFAVDMNPHNIFDLGPCIDHLRRVLAV